MRRIPTIIQPSPDSVDHDLRFLDHQARHYMENAAPWRPIYRHEVDLIRQLFALVPPELRPQLKWAGPA